MKYYLEFQNINWRKPEQMCIKPRLQDPEPQLLGSSTMCLKKLWNP
jgi:hypothetical protein